MGLFRRREPKFPTLVAVPAMKDLPKARLQSAARYLGTLNEADEKVTGQSMAAKSSSRLNLSDEALDVVRMAGSFRIPVEALRGATTATHFAGKAGAGPVGGPLGARRAAVADGVPDGPEQEHQDRSQRARARSVGTDHLEDEQG